MKPEYSVRLINYTLLSQYLIKNEDVLVSKISLEYKYTDLLVNYLDQ